MASFHAGRSSLVKRQAKVAGSTDAAADDMLAPIIAGAYARGVAETFEMLGLPGLFLDRSGEVLFASRAATPLLHGPLRLHMRHLVAEHPEDNQALGAFITDSVGDGGASATMCLPRAGLVLRRLPRSDAAALPGQLVRAVLLLADKADPRHVAILDLLA